MDIELVGEMGTQQLILGLGLYIPILLLISKQNKIVGKLSKYILIN